MGLVGVNLTAPRAVRGTVTAAPTPNQPTAGISTPTSVEAGAPPN
jgi:hypothetical protein